MTEGARERLEAFKRAPMRGAIIELLDIADEMAGRLSRYEAALRGIADYDFEQGVATWNTAVSIARAALSDGETK